MSGLARIDDDAADLRSDETLAVRDAPLRQIGELRPACTEAPASLIRAAWPMTDGTEPLTCAIVPVAAPINAIGSSPAFRLASTNADAMPSAVVPSAPAIGCVPGLARNSAKKSALLAAGTSGPGPPIPALASMSKSGCAVAAISAASASSIPAAGALLIPRKRWLTYWRAFWSCTRPSQAGPARVPSKTSGYGHMKVAMGAAIVRSGGGSNWIE
jgi:hypothetical protein